jgi:sigma-B regulation protein RsbQ
MAMSLDVSKRNNVTLSGHGSQPMLLAHGFGCDQNMWRFLAPAFEADYQVVAFDYVGAGKSDLNAYSVDRYSSLNGYVADLLDICHAYNLTDVICVGHSVSSMIALLAAIQAPQRFAQLILVAPSPCYINHPPDYVGGFERADVEGLLDIMEKNYIGWANLFAPMIMKNQDRPGLVNELETSFCSTDPVIARRFAEVTFFSDNRADLPKVTVPSLILQCSDDAIAPLAVGDYLHQHLPQSTLRVIQATGHCPHMSHPDECIQVIKDYLNADDAG